MRTNGAPRKLIASLTRSARPPSAATPCSFLYRTKTIQRWYSDLPDIDVEPALSESRRSFRLRYSDTEADHTEKSGRPSRAPDRSLNYRQEFSREEHNDVEFPQSSNHQDFDTRNVEFVPFEGGEDILSSTLSEPSSSLTQKEKRAFQRLQALAPKFEAVETVKPALVRRADSRTSQSSLDALLDDALSEPSIDGYSRPPSRQPEPSEAIPNDKLIKTRVRRHEIRSERTRIKRRLRRSLTDFELWEVLENDILNPVADSYGGTSLLTFSSDPGQLQIRKVKDEYLILLGSSVSLLLVDAAQILREHFPTSLLSTSIIPRLRQAGSAAFALGASTELFNMLLSQLVDMNEDMPAVVEVLSEMDRDVIEPDEETIKILTRVLDQTNEVRLGIYGEAVKSLWQTDRMRKAVKDIQRWVQERGENVGKAKASQEDPEEEEKPS